MAFYNFGNGTGDIGVPDMDSNEVLRRILAILNLSSSAFDPNTGGGGITSGMFSTAKDIVVAVAGTAVRGTNVGASRGILLTAFPTNTGSVYVGGPGVSRANGDQKGLILSQLGMPSTFLPIANVNQIYVNADNAGDGVGVLIF